MKRPAARSKQEAKRGNKPTRQTNEAVYEDSSDEIELQPPEPHESHPAWTLQFLQGDEASDSRGVGVDVATGTLPSRGVGLDVATDAFSGRGVGLDVFAQSFQQQWTRLAVQRLVSSGFFGNPGRRVALQLWADCGGVGTAIVAGRAIARALLEVHDICLDPLLHFYCDRDAVARRFVKQNMEPKHMAADMMQRNLQDGLYHCEKCSDNHEFPVGCIDLYVAGFPCTPWSRRGTRLGWDHPDVVPMKIGFKTIKKLQPAIWIYEVPEGVADQRAGSTESGLDQIQVYIANILGSDYFVNTARAIDPTWFGFPIRRPRVFLCGWRADVCDPNVAGAPLRALISEPILAPRDFLSFLGWHRSEDWSKVGEFPTVEDVAKLQQLGLTGCKCHENPMELCPLHVCPANCGSCGRDKLRCKWRRQMFQFVSQHETLRRVEPEASSRLSYVQVMALNGLETPETPRVRNVLNVIAKLPENTPLCTTMCIVDTSQTVTMASVRRDGLVPTLTTRSKLFSFRSGRFLSTTQLSVLMGFDVQAYDFAGTSESWWRDRMGLCMRVSCLGSMLAAAIAPALSAS